MGKVSLYGGAWLVAPIPAPSPVSDLTVTGNDYTATLTWTNPTDSSFYETVVVQKIGSAPTSLTDGEQICRGTDTEVTLEDLDINTAYYWAVFALNSKGSYMNGFPTVSYQTPDFPAYPTSFSQITAPTSSGTFTAPEDGWFQIELFGASGAGGNSDTDSETFEGSYAGSGTTSTDPDSRYDYLYAAGAAGGGGGGGGGVAVSVWKLFEGETISYTVGSGTCTCTTNGETSYSTMTVTAGAQGGSGSVRLDDGGSQSASGGSGGSGGSASGGNIGNYNGGRGGSGNAEADDSTSSEPDVSATGGSGGTPTYSGGRTGGAGAGAYTGNSSPGSGQKGYIRISRGNTNVVEEAA